MNKAQLHELIEAKQPNICQVAAYRDGKLVFSDEWNGYKDTDCTHIMSATKSIVALLVGIAVDRGEIGSIDDKVLSYFPDYQVKRGEKTIYDVTIRHLLTMRAPYKGKGDPWSKVCISENWTYASLDFLGGRGGLTDEFNYKTVCLHILSGILYKATGMTTVEYANEYLFKPLGIAEHENYYAKSAEEHKHFTMDKEPKTNVWFADRDGLGTPGYGLCMCAKDMAKIGQLCLNEGVWEGKQIISASWVKDMTRPRKIEGQMWRGMMYGYLWWITNPEKNIYAAIGNSGNVIYVNPDK
ncbi:MAG: serine hydrolase, partial [Clostridiales bacterium]|nr:serine hydrolase [Clostridiales bacterium]